jgi:hypothetical protein
MFVKAKASGRRRLTAIKDIVDWAARETQAFGRKSPLACKPPGLPLLASATYKAASIKRIG